MKIRPGKTNSVNPILVPKGITSAVGVALVLGATALTHAWNDSVGGSGSAGGQSADSSIVDTARHWRAESDVAIRGLALPQHAAASGVAAEADRVLSDTHQIVAAELDASARELFETAAQRNATAASVAWGDQPEAATADAERALETARDAVYAELRNSATTLFQASAAMEPPSVVRNQADERLAAEIDAARALTATQKVVNAELDRRTTELFYTSVGAPPATAVRVSENTEAAETGADSLTLASPME